MQPPNQIQQPPASEPEKEKLSLKLRPYDWAILFFSLWLALKNVESKLDSTSIFVMNFSLASSIFWFSIILILIFIGHVPSVFRKIANNKGLSIFIFGFSFLSSTVGWITAAGELPDNYRLFALLGGTFLTVVYMFMWMRITPFWIGLVVSLGLIVGGVVHMFLSNFDLGTALFVMGFCSFCTSVAHTNALDKREMLDYFF